MHIENKKIFYDIKSKEKKHTYPIMYIKKRGNAFKLTLFQVTP